MERGSGPDENNVNLLDKLQDAIGRGQNPMSIFSSSLMEPEIITISDSDTGRSGRESYSCSLFTGKPVSKAFALMLLLICNLVLET